MYRSYQYQIVPRENIDVVSFFKFDKLSQSKESKILAHFLIKN